VTAFGGGFLDRVGETSIVDLSLYQWRSNQHVTTEAIFSSLLDNEEESST
jgi:hypothetical protein